MLSLLVGLALAVAPPQLSPHESAALGDAWRAVHEMEKLARTPAEKALAARDRQAVEQLETMLRRRSEARAAVGAAAGGNSQQQLLEATRQMQETQMSFNLQYLQLQSQMQHENRSYTAISNIMKTKHDTVKNSISNVR